MTQTQAIELRALFGIDLEKDFHALPGGQVDRILSAAKAHGYRKPKNANGSRARYFHALLRRTANRKG